ncbi:UNVERIFIED_CONTAM: hypothetical protein Scaly_1616000 [Sesamum calycinum]|uniref:DUF4218 domain-containing protein n=1 Tax=Sesamum calycinum TaxID=2727403 RepID=A0AAW2P9T3_9LAMI
MAYPPMGWRLDGVPLASTCAFYLQNEVDPIAFHEMLLEPLWSALTEVGILFQIQCSTTLDVNKDQELEGSVVTILCNLKKIFPPIFFDSMEHLIVHLPYETHVGGLMEYRWMYQFERAVTSRSTIGEFDDESDEDSFEEDYETEEDNNYG